MAAHLLMHIRKCNNYSTLSLWAYTNRLIVNPTKCQAMVISPNIRKKSANIMPSPFLFENSKIDCVQSVKILGITISNDLSWDCHAASVRAKVNGMIGAIQRLGSSLNTDTRPQNFHCLRCSTSQILPFCLGQWLCDKCK